MIYVASPYSHPSPEIRSNRYQNVLRYCGRLGQKGLVCFSPIVYGHQFAINGFAQTDHLSWDQFNMHMLKYSTSMHLLMLPGWEKSRGIEHELSVANKENIKVEMILYENI